MLNIVSSPVGNTPSYCKRHTNVSRHKVRKALVYCKQLIRTTDTTSNSVSVPLVFFYLYEYYTYNTKLNFKPYLLKIRNRCRRRLKGIHFRSDTNRTGAESLSFYYPRLLYCLNQMLVVMLLSQHRVSSSKTVKPRAPCGARCIGHGVSLEVPTSLHQCSGSLAVG